MDRRTFLRNEVKFLKEKYNYKGTTGDIRCVEEGREAIKKIYDQVLNIEAAKKNEELYEQISTLNSKIKSLELENANYKRKKDKYSKEFEEAKQQNSINVKTLLLKDQEINKKDQEIFAAIERERNLLSENGILKAQKGVLETENEKLKSSIDRQVKEYSEMKRHLESIIKEKTNRLEKIIDENDNLREENLKIEKLTFKGKIKWLFKRG